MKKLEWREIPNSLCNNAAYLLHILGSSLKLTQLGQNFSSLFLLWIFNLTSLVNLSTFCECCVVTTVAKTALISKLRYRDNRSICQFQHFISPWKFFGLLSPQKRKARNFWIHSIAKFVSRTLSIHPRAIYFHSRKGIHYHFAVFSLSRLWAQPSFSCWDLIAINKFHWHSFHILFSWLLGFFGNSKIILSFSDTSCSLKMNKHFPSSTGG